MAVGGRSLIPARGLRTRASAHSSVTPAQACGTAQPRHRPEGSSGISARQWLAGRSPRPGGRPRPHMLVGPKDRRCATNGAASGAARETNWPAIGVFRLPGMPRLDQAGDEVRTTPGCRYDPAARQRRCVGFPVERLMGWRQRGVLVSINDAAVVHHYLREQASSMSTSESIPARPSGGCRYAGGYAGGVQRSAPLSSHQVVRAWCGGSARCPISLRSCPHRRA